MPVAVPLSTRWSCSSRPLAGEIRLICLTKESWTRLPCVFAALPAAGALTPTLVRLCNGAGIEELEGGDDCARAVERDALVRHTPGARRVGQRGRDQRARAAHDVFALCGLRPWLSRAKSRKALA